MHSAISKKNYLWPFHGSMSLTLFRLVFITLAKVFSIEEVSNIVSMTTHPFPYFVWQSCTFRFVSCLISPVLVRFISGLRYKPVGLLLSTFASNFRKYEAFESGFQMSS